MDCGGGARYYMYCSRNARAARQTPNKLIYFCELVMYLFQYLVTMTY
ncbi:hypothetical protein E2C01_037030 [Portunus trituberculatus]|uniref:Uncharacterized protein n=1 Tax=Portunus trituberculatus TaxID=210409 RepID=A0A5B7FD15_PORTR|nr:hypothetical protein [Portunus trituberculatus]